MSEIDRIFAKFRDRAQPVGDRRELRTVPDRASGRGGRVVEVVRRRGSGGTDDARPHRPDHGVRAATWEKGFPARSVVAPAPPPEPAPPAAAAPTAHVMRAWEPSAGAEPSPAPEAAKPVAAPRPKPARRFADPFDAADDGANCLRCGYAVEPGREKRGLLTCAACG